MMKFFYGPGACSFAVHIALEEIGAPYEGIMLDLSKWEQRGDDYLALNPQGRVPTLIDDNLVLTEVGAILSYLVEKHPEAELFPTDLINRAMAHRWMFWMSNTLHVGFGLVNRTYRYTGEESHYESIREGGRKIVHDCFQLAEDRLTGDFMVGDHYSVVDSYIVVFYRWGITQGYEADKRYPKLAAICERVLERPAVQRTMELEGITRTGKIAA